MSWLKVAEEEGRWDGRRRQQKKNFVNFHFICLRMCLDMLENDTLFSVYLVFVFSAYYAGRYVCIVMYDGKSDRLLTGAHLFVSIWLYVYPLVVVKCHLIGPKTENFPNLNGHSIDIAVHWSDTNSLEFEVLIKKEEHHNTHWPILWV